MMTLRLLDVTSPRMCTTGLSGQATAPSQFINSSQSSAGMPSPCPSGFMSTRNLLNLSVAQHTHGICVWKSLLLLS